MKPKWKSTQTKRKDEKEHEPDVKLNLSHPKTRPNRSNRPPQNLRATKTTKELLQLPRRYQSYQPANGGASTILYAAIPWTAGGLGDGHWSTKIETPAYDCQDGGFDPTSKPIEQKEHEHGKESRNQRRKKVKEKNRRKKKRNRKKPASSQALTRRSPTSSTCPEPGRQLRHGPGRSDHQPDRCRAAEHRHRSAVECLAGPKPATRRPTSAATSLRRTTVAALDRMKKHSPALSTTSHSSGGNYYLNDAFNRLR